jgi:hypothetical protein
LEHFVYGKLWQSQTELCHVLIKFFLELDCCATVGCVGAQKYVRMEKGVKELTRTHHWPGF